ncbi:hypothetical protein LOK49_LG11G02803 [Camellia lanceoleosa]|uniref:Uncharacterized protein n=1 Tax=Camellia lanceoleosa TaxID=1840588 RepID=A0ACC0G684_9ERIC|nr:hypothetical protein LOK49_LG11G02803 [Camellia lanceoleosa]
MDSDSAYSSKEKGSKNEKLQNEFQKVTDDIKQELQVADLKRELTETTEEKEAEKMISDLKMEAETLNGENSNFLQELVTESSQLREKVGERERELASHTEMHETHKSETSARMGGLELVLDSLHTQKGEIEKQKADELSSLLKKLEEKEKEDEDEKDGNTDYSFSFSSSGLGSKSKDGEGLTEVEDGNVGNEEDEDEKDGNTDFSFSSSGLDTASIEKKRLAFVFLKLFQECKANLEDAERKIEEIEEEELQKSTEDSLSEKNIARQRKLEEDSFDFEVLIEETSARMRGLELELDSLRTQKGEIEKQKADQLSSLLKKLEEKDADQRKMLMKDLEREVDSQNSDFEFPTFADEIRPVFPIFGRDELDGVPASDASAVAESPERCKKNNERVKPTVAGGGVTVAPGRDRRRLLMPYRQEGFFANISKIPWWIKTIMNPGIQDILILDLLFSSDEQFL